MKKLSYFIGALAAIVVFEIFFAGCPTPQGPSLSNDASLSSLAVIWVGAKPLTFGFVPGTTDYNLSVPNSLDNVTVTPAASSSSAKIKINGSGVASGQAIVAALSVGSNQITVEVTAEDGSTVRNYIVNVTRTASDSTNAKLAWLLLSHGDLNPAFHENTRSYSASVGLSVDTITATPFMSDASATVQINGSSASHATPFGPISLSAGNNNITILVAAANRTDTRTYTITVNRAASTNANLSTLVPSVGALSPGFSSTTTTYTVSVANAVSGIAFTATSADAGATIKINDAAVVSGQQSGSIALSVGTNVMNVVVTAQDGATTKTYAVTVNRAARPSISGTISEIGAGTIGPTSPLVVWWRKVNSSIHGVSTYSTGSFPRTFSLPDMENGKYYVGAFLDKDNNGHSSPGDLFGQCSGPVLVNDASVTNLQITIGLRNEGEIAVWLSNVPAEYNLWWIYLVVLAPEADLLVDPWKGYGCQVIMGGSSGAVAFDIGSNSKTFAGGSYAVYLFVDYFPSQPSLDDLRNNPPQGVLYGERLVMVDGTAQVSFNFGDLVEFQP
jgi:Cadherin-like beta sandwich domain